MLLSPACKVLFLCYNEAMDERYSRTALLLGEEGIERLKTLCVAVVGLGAVGGFAAEMLARAGTGTIRLIDFDRFETSNLNRQLLATTQTLGQLKTEAAAERIAAIAPDCRTEIRTLFFSKESADAALAPRPDAVIDAIDSLEAKADLIEECVLRHIPIFSSMGAALKTDADAIRTGDLFRSEVCPLAKKLRTLLRRRGAQTEVFCVYSVQPPAKNALGEPEAAGARRPPGSLATLPALFGIRLAHEVIMRAAENRL